MIIKQLARSSTTRLVTSSSAPAAAAFGLGLSPPGVISEWITNNNSLLPNNNMMGPLSFASVVATSVLEAAPNSISEVQTFGEKAFAAAFLVAIFQAAVAVFQYQTNPSGQLVVPPGPTQGVAMPQTNNESTDDADAAAATTSAALGVDNNKSKKKDSWFEALKELESTFSVQKEEDHDKENASGHHHHNLSPSEQYAATMQRINKSLVLLLPWATNVFAFLLERNVHLFHLGFIFALAQLFDFPHRLVSNHHHHHHEEKKNKLSLNNDVATKGGRNNQGMHTRTAFVSEKTTPAIPSSSAPERILVLGDSLAAGVGAVHLYEAEQEEIPKEQQLLAQKNGPGPVFPRVLAQSLATKTGKPVHWRCEGVVGGDTGDIEEMCLFALQEEVDKGQPPDIVVVISGINDLKHFACNPVKYPGPQAFRDRLVSVIDKIHEISPNSKIILPALPTQMFRRDSPLNIFPLVGFVSAIVGFWDAQKKYVAHRYPDSQVEYIGLTPSEIYKWYMTDATSEFAIPTMKNNEDDMIGLISADGIHPNAKCYAHWAASLAEKLDTVNVNKNVESSPSAPSNTPLNRQRRRSNNHKIPTFAHT